MKPRKEVLGDPSPPLKLLFIGMTLEQEVMATPSPTVHAELCLNSLASTSPVWLTPHPPSLYINYQRQYLTKELGDK